MLQVKVNRGNLFKQYLLWLDPILELTKVEREILGALLALHYNHKDYDVKILNELLFSEETLGAIRKKLKMTEKVFTEAFSRLKEREYILDGVISPQFINYPKDGKFRVQVEFVVDNG